MRISDWSSDVCSSDLLDELLRGHSRTQAEALRARLIEASAPAALVERIVALSALDGAVGIADLRSEEHTSELQSLMRISYAVFCLKKKINKKSKKETT